MPKAPAKLGRPHNRDLAQRRRDDILRCAIPHFAKVGYTEIDLNALARDAACSKGTLFRYFPSKKNLFEAAVDRVMREMLAATDAVLTNDPLENVIISIRTTLAFFDAHPQYVELLIQERAEFRDRRTPSFFEYIKNHCDPQRCDAVEIIRSGRVRDIPTDRIMDVALNLVYGTIFTQYFARHDKSFQQQAGEILDIFLHGILAPTESARRQKKRA